MLMADRRADGHRVLVGPAVRAPDAPREQPARAEPGNAPALRLEFEAVCAVAASGVSQDCDGSAQLPTTRPAVTSCSSAAGVPPRTPDQQRAMGQQEQADADAHDIPTGDERRDGQRRERESGRLGQRRSEGGLPEAVGPIAGDGGRGGD